MSKVTRPVLRWHGGKWLLAPWIISHFPPHRIYVEPFGGAASVLLRKERAYAEVYNDLEGEVVNLFRVLRERPSDLVDMLRLTPFSREEYATLYEAPTSELERARALIARSFLGQSSKGALRKSGFDTRINSDGYCSRLSSFRGVADELPRLAARFERVIVECLSAIEVMRIYDRPSALFYLDPPYHPDAVSATHYRHELTDDDHRHLLGFLTGLSGMVVLSGYPHPMYDDMLAGWHRVERRALADGARERTEVLWINPLARKRWLAAQAQPDMFVGAQA